MRSLLVLQSALLTVLVLAPIQAPAQTLGIYGDLNALTCPVIAPIGPSMLYVVATLEPAACGGITGAEFRVQGLPTGWFYIAQPGPGVGLIGDPTGDGAQISFGCQTSESGAVVVMPILAFATSLVMDVPVTVVQRTAAVAPFLCPVLKLCDAPVFTAVCATGFPTRINNQFGGFCPCQDVCYAICPPIGVEANSWSGIKRLYN